jgi:hypothetical protein
MYCNNCWSFKHAFNKYNVQEITISSSTLKFEASILKELDAIPLTKFGQNSAALSQLSTRTTSRNLALGEVQLPSCLRHQDCICASTIRRRQCQHSTSPCRRRLCRPCTAAGPCSGSSFCPPRTTAAADAPLQKGRAGRGGNKTRAGGTGRAGSG